MFLEINQTGNQKLLIKSGTATPSQCVEQWEKIIQENNKAQGKQDYNLFLKTYKTYSKLLADFTAIKSHLLILCYCLDYEAMRFVRSKGYKIDTTNSAKYADSLAAAIRKSDNILTKLQLKKNELLLMRPEAPGKADSFESLIAAMSFELGIALQDNLTLARYNEYLRLIERKQKAIKQAKERPYGRT